MSNTTIINTTIIRNKTTCANHISPEKYEAIIESKKYQKWFNQFFSGNEIILTNFTITDVDFFGAIHPNNVGFIKGFGNATDNQGNSIPSIVFIRGESVAVLIIVQIKDNNKEYILVCKQARFPVGCIMTEACAGMVDENTGDLIGVVFKEVYEETGFVLNTSELISLGSIFPSPGGCDEEIHLFAWKTTITEADFEEKQTKIYGVNTSERIHLDFISCNADEIEATRDPKLECAWSRYQNISIKEKIKA
jgi:ADP-sugar diphosphatase